MADYTLVWQKMRDFTDTRSAQTEDELWVVEHPSVYTLGQAGKSEHILNSAGIPVVNSDRGGQVTYHGPGQLIVYTLLDLRRAGLGIRNLVETLENAIIDTLEGFNVSATGRRDAPGVYVRGQKIAALGLRVRKGCSYHGLSFNVDMDLTPFSGINPCGFQGMEVTSLTQLGIDTTVSEVQDRLLSSLQARIAPTAEQ